jgi:hypothetical protein
VGVGDRCLPGYLLTIGNLRRTEIGRDLVGTLEDIDFVGKVRLVHTVDDDLTRFRVGGHLERQILSNERGERNGKLILVSHRLRLDRDLDQARRLVNVICHQSRQSTSDASGSLSRGAQAMK